jgi:hypothetical protein
MTLIIANTSARSVSADNAELYFVSPVDGAVVTNPVTIRFGLKNMGVAPAGIKMENTGHHHLLIDTALSVLTRPIPKGEQHRHFGKGQTETELTLSPGQHTLQLLLGDFSHIPHEPPVISRKITITVR